jgi:polyhydroxybutyrate depolymerase
MSHYLPSLLAITAVIFTSVLVRAAEPETRPASGNQLRTLVVDRRQRLYLLHLPAGYNPSKPAPVVLAFHGAAMNGAMMEGFSGLSEKADEAGFIVVYPYGTGLGNLLLTFNAWGNAKPDGPADDVAFTAAVLDDLATTVNVDPKRVFATGMSNGGMMCYRLAAELSDRIAAIAPVAGTLAIPECHPNRPVPVIHFHGTADWLVPFNGPGQWLPSFMKPEILNMKSVEDTVRLWVELNGCPPEPQVTSIADSADDGTTVTRRVYGPGQDGAEVVLLTITGGGHTWPGRQTIVPLIGASTMNISANDLIWDFFLKHPMK